MTSPHADSSEWASLVLFRKEHDSKKYKSPPLRPSGTGIGDTAFGGQAAFHSVSPNAPTAISSEPSLNERLHQWIVDQSSEEIATRFSPWVEAALRDLEYNLERPAYDETFGSVQAALRRADITPSRMEQAFREARRAEDEGLSTLKWIQEVQGRAFSKRVAEKSFQRAKRRLAAFSKDHEPSLHEPPSAEQVFAFFLVWEEMGGTAALAALREVQRRDRGHPPSN